MTPLRYTKTQPSSCSTFFKNETASAALNAQPSAEHTDKKHRLSRSGETRSFIVYPQVASFSLKKYTIDEAIAEIESKLARFSQPAIMTPSQYGKHLVTKTLHCRDLKEEYAPNGIFIKGLAISIFHRICEYWRSMNGANLHELAYNGASMLERQGLCLASKKTNPSPSISQTKRGKPCCFHNQI